MAMENVLVEEATMSFGGGNIPLKMAAQIMQKDYQSVRLGLIKGLYPIGVAMKAPGSKAYNFYISPKLFYEFTGCVVTDDMIEQFKKINK